MAQFSSVLLAPKRRPVDNMRRIFSECEDGDVWGVTSVSAVFGRHFARGPLRKSASTGAITLGGQLLTSGATLLPARYVVAMTQDPGCFQTESVPEQPELLEHGVVVAARFHSFGNSIDVVGYLVKSIESGMLGVGHHIVASRGRVSVALQHLSVVETPAGIGPAPRAVRSWSDYDESGD